LGVERTKRHIVVGQRVTDVKAERAREMRRSPTAAEGVLWQCLRRNQLLGLHFRRQQPIDGFIADFYCHAVGLVVEIDGDSHAGRESYDLARDEILASRGLRILRVTNTDVLDDLPRVLNAIARAAQAVEGR
jgi:very-short-patch-repair endonuclease